MLNKTFLAGLACAIALSAPAFGQGGNYSLGGAIGGTAILGATRYDNAPLSALWIDRSAHVSGNYTNAIAKFDRVIRPDGSVVVMRRIPDAANPNGFSYLPSSWPAVGAMGKERVMDASGGTIAERDVIISQFDILAAGIPANGPSVATLSFERTIMPDGTRFLTAAAENPDPNVAVALLGNERGLRQIGIGVTSRAPVAVASR